MHPKRLPACTRAMLSAAALAVAAAAPAHAQGAGDPVAELIRKADAREADNGFCATVTDWPPGTSDGYAYFLRTAQIGYAKVNRFRNNVQCQFDRVIDIYNSSEGKCVRYVWWACATGSSCARGEDTECRQADGSWRRQAK